MSKLAEKIKNLFQPKIKLTIDKKELSVIPQPKNIAIKDLKEPAKKNRMKRIRKRNTQAARKLKPIIAGLLVVLAISILYYCTKTLNYNVVNAFWFYAIAALPAIVVGITAIPKHKDFMKPLVDTLLYYPAAISTLIFILSSIQEIDEKYKHVLLNSAFAYLTLWAISICTILKLSISFHDLFEKYVKKCKKSNQYNLTTRIIRCFQRAKISIKRKLLRPIRKIFRKS
ncbi:hypothetical protein [uncultured Pantoea sp.]|uniref:hypothetical protein n=1 Tax=uncultured Pantoea sp. TaxID=218084 RepID=UPI0025E6D29E|nr:hypothetical protein [uncultured Pantoea sp.]